MAKKTSSAAPLFQIKDYLSVNNPRPAMPETVKRLVSGANIDA